jgi:hypothetical protein
MKLVERHSALPGPATCGYLVRFAPGEADEAILARPIWGGGYTFLDRVPGQPLFRVNPNSHFDPTQQLVLNPAAWVEPPYGTFSNFRTLLQRLSLAAAAREAVGPQPRSGQIVARLTF